MTGRKRGRQELEADGASHEPSILNRIRNMWQFANLMQFLFTFGKAVRIDENLAIEDLETELRKPGHSEKLTEIGLGLLKFITSHRGLTTDMFDEHTRRQYQQRAPERNPFGDDEKAARFSELDIFTKIRVLYQLAQWTMVHSDRIRERMEDKKDREQAYWRVDPTGWDADERTYFLLDDNRLYRRTDPAPPPPPAPKPKKNSKKAKALARAEKRRKLAGGDPADETSIADNDGAGSESKLVDDGFGGFKWECIAITTDDYKRFMENIKRSKDPNEQSLYERCRDDIMPVVEKAEEELHRKMAKREKELRNLARLATAKRSSRIAGKAEREREEAEAAEAERKRHADLAAARKEQERLARLERERESRIMTREQRLKERETRRTLQEQELASLSEDSKKAGEAEVRMSERHIKGEIEKRKKQLEALEPKDEWFFDCSGCGVYGENVDDGTSTIACEKCDVWQHLSCLGISETAAKQRDFHFICSLCKRREEDRKKSARNPIKLNFRKLGASTSPPMGQAGVTVSANGSPIKRKSSEDHHGASKKVKQTGSGTMGGQSRAVGGAASSLSRPATANGGEAPSSHPPLYTWSHGSSNGIAASSTRSSDVSFVANGMTSSHPNGASTGAADPAGNQAPASIGQLSSLDASGGGSSSATSPGLQLAASNGVARGASGLPQSTESRPGSPTKPSGSGPSQNKAFIKDSHAIFTPGPRIGNPAVNGVFSGTPKLDPSPGVHKTPGSLAPGGSNGCAHESSATMTPSAAVSALPPSSSGISPTKRSPRPSSSPKVGPISAGKGMAMVLQEDTPLLHAAPMLSPSPQQVDLTPPQKKWTGAAPPPPAELGVQLQAQSLAAQAPMSKADHLRSPSPAPAVVGPAGTTNGTTHH